MVQVASRPFLIREARVRFQVVAYAMKKMTLGQVFLRHISTYQCDFTNTQYSLFHVPSALYSSSN
jgi:hypothetical protein